MNPLHAHNRSFSGPIDPDWTIDEFLFQLAAGDCPDEDLIPELRRLEAAMGRAAGSAAHHAAVHHSAVHHAAAHRSSARTAIALTRSIAMLRLVTPRLRAVPLGELLGEAPAELPESASREPSIYAAIS
ncbi:hypothetical protein ACFPZL_05250 [Leucobacter soli]|uniref:Uncharacterized protein n=1 Tax=Leucobacter soli TaxID=2812850 RepID=A0A916JR47_9MICO|nr:hypothetical protein [Leucobacter soli]CAG7595676.1 hypothetical protein LEUCIP111803_00053 [Leucobacter soli]